MLSVLGVNIVITDEIITMWAIMAFILVFALIVRHNLKERPGALQNIAEICVEYLENFLHNLLGKAKTAKYFTFLSTLFIFIIVSNYSSFIPGMGVIPGMKAPTSSLSVTLGLSITTFLFLQYYSLKLGAKHYAKRFFKPILLFPLFLLDELVKPVSLSLRLFGNIFGEETVSDRLYAILPIGAPIIMMLLGLLFCYIQAMVFTMLTAMYIDEATEIEQTP